MRRLLLSSVIAAGAVLLAGCGSGSSPTAGASGSAVLSGTLEVFAAASLKESFTRLGNEFHAAHPGVDVVFNFGPSNGLALQITQGAPADVFAAASTVTMQTVVQAGDASDPKTFATNVLEVAIPVDNPAGVTALADLTKPGVKVAVCRAQVPCGAADARLFAMNRLTVHPVTYEVDVKAVLTKVQLGEVDAGLVYTTDVHAAGTRVHAVPIPAADNVSTAYPIAALTASPDKSAAQAFVAYVLSPTGKSALAAARFGPP
ncbi:MAG TPA: molybdate ABC transporter substrate-binding protein [Actinomycetes bacterium]